MCGRLPRRQVQIFCQLPAQFRQLRLDGGKLVRLALITRDPMQIGRSFKPGRDGCRRRILGHAAEAMQEEFGHKIESQCFLECFVQNGRK